MTARGRATARAPRTTARAKTTARARASPGRRARRTAPRKAGPSRRPRRSRTRTPTRRCEDPGPADAGPFSPGFHGDHATRSWPRSRPATEALFGGVGPALARRPVPACARHRSPLLGQPRRPLRARPVAAALHRRGSRARRRACGARAGPAREADRAGERLVLRDVPGFHDGRVGVPRRGRRARRLRHPARREQCLREQPEPRLRPLGVPRRHPARSRRPIPSGGLLRQGDLVARFARRLGARAGLAALPRGAQAIRPRADARRVGRPHPAARGVGGGEPQGDRHRAGGPRVMKLAELQQRFWERVTRAPEARSAVDCFVSTPQLSADERLEIYANMFVWRQIDALREDFPKLAQLLGDEGFYATAEKYLRVHPSTHPSLGQLGRQFASFLAETGGHRPDVADLAVLEWARCEVFETGWGKVHNLDAMAERFEGWGIPAPALSAALSGYTELIGGTLVLIGLLTRLASIPMVINMVVAILVVRMKKVSGLDEFAELDEPLYALSFLWLAFSGPGKASLDHLLFRVLRRRPAQASQPAAPAG